MPAIPAALCAGLAALNFFAVRGKEGAEFLYAFTWFVCGAMALYALISFLEPRVSGKLESVCHFLRRCAQWGAAAGAVFFIVVQCFIISGQKTTARPGADYVIVMGAGLKDGSEPSATLKSRLDAAYDYLSENEGATAIMTGGQGADESLPEAEAMRDYLVGRGLDPSRIITEGKSHNTNENFRFAAEFVPEGSSVVVISNEFHLYRCVILAKRNGITGVMTVAAPTPTPMLRISCHLREFFSVVLMWTGLSGAAQN